MSAGRRTTVTSSARGLDAWVHFSAIEIDGYRSLRAGASVDFDYEPAEQDGFRFVATSVRKL